MKLSTADRWVLANQYRIMQMLANKPIPLYEHAIEILENGYEDQYRYAAQYLREEPFSREVAEEVKDILQMFREMQWIRERIDDQSVLESPRFQFQGFDGNTSHPYLSYAHFLWKLGEYEELGERLKWNSHRDTLETYRAMVETWKALPRRGLQLTQEDIEAILNATAEERN